MTRFIEFVSKNPLFLDIPAQKSKPSSNGDQRQVHGQPGLGAGSGCSSWAGSGACPICGGLLLGSGADVSESGGGGED